MLLRTLKIRWAGLLVIAMMFGAGCRAKVVKVVYVIPSTFTGVCIIRSNMPNGSDILQENGAYKFVFPDNGEINLTGEDPTIGVLLDASARDSSGKSLPFEGAVAVPPHTKGVFLESTDGQGTVNLFVGTPEQRASHRINYRPKE